MDASTTEEQEPQPPPTVPDKFSVNLRGFPNDAATREFGEFLGGVVSWISRWINVERLDGITVAYDYNEALANLNRGFQTSMPLVATSDNEIIGVAMTPAVFRDGVVKAHIIFYAGVVLPLKMRDRSPEFLQALYLVAHECGHVEDWRNWDQAFPNTLFQTRVSIVEDWVLSVEAEPLWREYAACRVSARFRPEQTALMEENLVSVMKDAKNQCNDAIRRYRVHGDVNRVLDEASRPICRPLRMTSYLLGHLAGLGKDLADIQITRDLLMASPYGKYVELLQGVLEDLWAERGQWNSLQVFSPLKDIIRNVFADGGLILSRREAGQLHVDFPFTPETMPV